MKRLGAFAMGAVISGCAAAWGCGASPPSTLTSTEAPPPKPTHQPPAKGASFPADPAPASAPTLASPSSSQPPVPPGASPRATFDASLGRAVNGKMRELTRCYDEGRKRKPGLKGDFAMEFVVAPTGKVISVTADPATTIPEPATVTCMVGVVSAITTVQNPTNAEIRSGYSVNFNAPADAM